ncbi:MAG: Tim44 domain-containing protein [Parvularculaceae bacterium]|nr:Tim44 domain-containing protein [Parvularculaceae bacterium]
MDLSIIIFAAVALFLSYRLFTVLGSRDGHEPEEGDRPVLRPVGAEQDQAEPEAATKAKPLPAWAEVIAEHYRAFDVDDFLSGSASAYEMIAQSFAKGDLSEVSGFVADDVLSSFQGAIDERNASGHEMAVTFVGVETPEVVSSERDGDEIRVEVKFTSEQVRVVNDSSGQTVEGSAEAVITVVDQWAFTRPVKSNNPNWTLVATTGSA